MPSSLATSLIALGAVLTAMSAAAGALVAGAGVFMELVSLYFAGRS